MEDHVPLGRPELSSRLPYRCWNRDKLLPPGTAEALGKPGATLSISG
jgi:hypothetical protein